MTARRFIHEGLPSRVLFGHGAVAGVLEEARRLGMERPLVISSSGRTNDALFIKELLHECVAGHFANAQMHTPVEITEEATRYAAENQADGLVAIGGGSATGLGKAIALRTDLPQIVVPTTYAGSEMTPILGETKDGLKTTQRSLGVLPETVIYDPDLTTNLPPGASLASGLNAIAHAAEALYAEGVSPTVVRSAEDGIEALLRALPIIVSDPSNTSARYDALYGAWLCGMCLGSVGMALHHKLCHILGGSLNLPHAETHSVILPHALAFNLHSAPEARSSLTRASGWQDPAVGLHDFAKRLGAATSLRALGMREEDIGPIADLAVANPYPNPRPFDRDSIARLITRAWRGEAPAID